MSSTSPNGGFVVVGASLAGLRAVEAARRGGFAGPVTVVGAETHLPYDRPPLSKAYLTAADAATTFYRSATELTELDADIRLGVRATSLDPSGRVVHTTSGPVPYERLLVATGAVPRLLPLPEFTGVRTLRTLDDAVAVRAELRTASRVVVVGAGFIGAEIASSAVAVGCREVTIVEAARTPLVRAVGEEVGSALAALHHRHGVTLLRGVGVAGLVGAARVEGVVLDDGRTIPADLVVVGVGAVPATGWLAGSDVVLDQRDGGVVCDEHLQSSVPGVYAAGDVAHWPNPLFGTTMRLENWTNAADQAAAATVNALFPDRRRPYETVPYFWSDWYGQRIQFVGSTEADSVDFVSGGPGEERFVALFRRGDLLVGAATLNEPRKIMKYRRHIAVRAPFADALALTSAGARG